MSAEWSAIVAVDMAWCIGAAGELPWRLPDDLRRFRALTLGGVVVMGRRTHESIGRALPGRRNIVLTRRPGYEAAPGCEVVESVAALLATLASEPRQVWVIGGGEVYEALMPSISRLELTLVNCHVGERADAWLAPLSEEGWEVEARSSREADATHAYEQVWLTLRRVEVCDWRGGAGAEVPGAWR